MPAHAYHEFVTFDPETCYRAMLAHDARFDGRFFTGVSSTGIYCRPICRVKVPKRENCTFFSSAAAAEAAGYRPCLRCRPELAPGNASFDASRRIAQSAARLIEEGLLDEAGIDDVALRLGITARHLRRVFQNEFGVSPVAFAQTQRLLLAKRLLTDTQLPVTEIAFASGFQSVRRLNATFKERYRLSPSQIRKTPKTGSRPDTLVFNLSYRPPYDWDALIAFLSARSVTGVEWVTTSGYRRIVRIVRDGQAHSGWMEITHSPERNAMRVVASASLAKVIPAFLSRVKYFLDLSCNPSQIGEGLGKLASAKPGLRVPGAFDGFEIAVRAVLGQQVSVAAARTLAGRLAAAHGSPIEAPFEELKTAFPLPEQIAGLTIADLTRLGILASRARTIIELANALVEDTIRLSPGYVDDSIIDKLQSITGIGEWTAQYIAMRALGWPDAFPHTDLGVMKALGEKNPKRILAAAEAWRPWRAYAVMHLWATGSSNGLAL